MQPEQTKTNEDSNDFGGLRTQYEALKQEAEQLRTFKRNVELKSTLTNLGVNNFSDTIINAFSKFEATDVDGIKAFIEANKTDYNFGMDVPNNEGSNQTSVVNEQQEQIKNSFNSLNNLQSQSQPSQQSAELEKQAKIKAIWDDPKLTTNEKVQQSAEVARQ